LVSALNPVATTTPILSPNIKQLSRFLGIQANSSSLGPEELNNCGVLKQENFEEMINNISYLLEHFNFKIIGGGCGTNDIFIAKLTKRLT
jgi:methionine synthase I (cobalamin-dependent)